MIHATTAGGRKTIHIQAHRTSKPQPLHMIYQSLLTYDYDPILKFHLRFAPQFAEKNACEIVVLLKSS
jgi:hypothetical protein